VVEWIYSIISLEEEWEEEEHRREDHRKPNLEQWRYKSSWKMFTMGRVRKSISLERGTVKHVKVREDPKSIHVHHVKEEEWLRKS